jgi:hypothetical protein
MSLLIDSWQNKVLELWIYDVMDDLHALWDDAINWIFMVQSSHVIICIDLQWLITLLFEVCEYFFSTCSQSMMA